MDIRQIRAMRRFWLLVKSQWFITGVVLAILLAKAAPWIGRKGGPLKPEKTIKFCVAAIFFIIGVSLQTRQLRDTVFQWKMHAVIQGFSLLLAPLLAIIVCSLLERCVDWVILPETSLHRSLLSMFEGVKVLACMPPPVSSAVILTKAVGGNEAAAAFNSTLGSFLGVMVTPLVLLYVTGRSAGAVPMTSMMASLGSQIILPILLGQIIRNFSGLVTDATLKRYTVPNRTYSKLLIFAGF
jgi:solute carrier family 10 (sodium/bile acid cotransporter), member 7